MNFRITEDVFWVQAEDCMETSWVQKCSMHGEPHLSDNIQGFTKVPGEMAGEKLIIICAH